MSKTHFSIVIAATLAITQSQTPHDCCIALIGRAVDGVLPDCDILDNDYTGDAKRDELIILGLTVLILCVDLFFDY